MTQSLAGGGVSLPVPRDVGLADLRAALVLGLRDFRAAPVFGLFFAAIYVLAGLVLLSLGAGFLTWTLALSLGFPLAGPFLAVGLYEVSRRIEAGTQPRFGPVLAVVWAERNRQIPWAGAVIVLYLLFWSFFAHMLFALFMGPMSLIGPPDASAYLGGRGLALVVAELAFGGIFALLLFSLMVVSLPMMLDREIDFVSAMRVSLRLVRRNPGPMLIWAAIIGAASLVALLPWFLGLFVVLPVLGHASWHLYRRAVTV